MATMPPAAPAIEWIAESLILQICDARKEGQVDVDTAQKTAASFMYRVFGSEMGTTTDVLRNKSHVCSKATCQCHLAKFLHGICHWSRTALFTFISINYKKYVHCQQALGGLCHSLFNNFCSSSTSFAKPFELPDAVVESLFN